MKAVRRGEERNDDAGCLYVGQIDRPFRAERGQRPGSRRRIQAGSGDERKSRGDRHTPRLFSGFRRAARRLVISSVYELPFGTGKKHMLASAGSWWWNKIVGGWEVSFIADDAGWAFPITADHCRGDVKRRRDIRDRPGSGRSDFPTTLEIRTATIVDSRTTAAWPCEASSAFREFGRRGSTAVRGPRGRENTNYRSGASRQDRCGDRPRIRVGSEKR